MAKSKIRTEAVAAHFDSLAPDYDRLKRKNGFYYDQLKEIVRFLVPPGKNVLDIGTGIGDLLDCVKPFRGTGIDISGKMIAIAKNRYPQYDFHVADYKYFQKDDIYEYIIVADVIEHLDEAVLFFSHVRRLMSEDTAVVLTMANPRWDFFLTILEKLGAKMKEGSHYRISKKDLLAAAQSNQFEITAMGSRTLIPIRIPVLTWIANRLLVRIPFVGRLALIQYFSFRANRKHRTTSGR